MLQKIVTILILFLVPFILFGIYLYVLRWRRQQEEEGTLPKWWDEVPWFWLSLAGVGLIFILLAYYRTQNAEDIGGTYIPPKMENGEIVPGTIDKQRQRSLHDNP